MQRRLEQRQKDYQRIISDNPLKMNVRFNPVEDVWERGWASQWANCGWDISEWIIVIVHTLESASAVQRLAIFSYHLHSGLSAYSVDDQDLLYRSSTPTCSAYPEYRLSTFSSICWFSSLPSSSLLRSMFPNPMKNIGVTMWPRFAGDRRTWFL